MRPSRWARLMARLIRIRKIHVFIEARPSKRSSPFRTPSHVSCTTSSAIVRLRT